MLGPCWHIMPGAHAVVGPWPGDGECVCGFMLKVLYELLVAACTCNTYTCSSGAGVESNQLAELLMASYLIAPRVHANITSHPTSDTHTPPLQPHACPSVQPPPAPSPPSLPSFPSPPLPPGSTCVTSASSPSLGALSMTASSLRAWCLTTRRPRQQAGPPRWVRIGGGQGLRSGPAGRPKCWRVCGGESARCGQTWGVGSRRRVG